MVDMSQNIVFQKYLLYNESRSIMGLILLQRERGGRSPGDSEPKSRSVAEYMGMRMIGGCEWRRG